MLDQASEEALVGLAALCGNVIFRLKQGVTQGTLGQGHMHVVAFKGEFRVPKLAGLYGNDHIGVDGRGVGIDIRGAAPLYGKLQFKLGGPSVLADRKAFCGDAGIVDARSYKGR